ncbi:MAG: DUF1800 domain-containing protein [Gemmatimonas sp.]
MLRRFVAAGAAAMVLAAGAAQPAAAGKTMTPEQRAVHLLNRIGYGPRPGDVERVTAMGIERYIEQQLSPRGIPESPELMQRLDELRTLRMSPSELFDRYEPHAVLGRRPTPDEAKAIREKSRVVLREAIEARLLRATLSERRLEQVMTDFWFNHFNVFAGKGLDRLWVGAFENEAIRPYALGRFRDLLGATAKHPAMLFYLDNWQNTAPGSAGARGREQGLNENYAREIMELHTLGVDGGYTQADVVALARIFTGWGLPRGQRFVSGRDGFFFDARRHDNGPKTFLGRTIRPAGMAEGELAMDMLARSPATAHHIAFQLAQYFVADEPSPALVERLAARYRETDGDIREVLRTLLKSGEFWDAASGARKYKTPYEYVVSALRLAGAPVGDVRPVAGLLSQLGMPLYGCQTPDGYKMTSDAWLNPDAMMRRVSFAAAFGAGQTRIGRPESMPDTPRPLDSERLLAALGHAVAPKTVAAVEAAPPQLKAGVVLGSPDFMTR